MNLKIIPIFILLTLLFCFVVSANDAAILKEPEPDTEYGVGPDGLTIGIILSLVVLFVIIISLILQNYKVKKRIMADFTDLDNVLKELKTHRGRITEQHLKQVFGYSKTEMKIILKILEKENKIRRYKEGKKKIIVLKT